MFLAWMAVIVAVEALTELIVASQFTFPIRDWFSRISEPKGFWQKLRAWVGYLLNCGYCTSVWVAMLAAGFFVPVPDYAICAKYSIPIYIIKVLIIHRLSNLMHELFKKWFNRSPLSVVLTHRGENNGPQES